MQPPPLPPSNPLTTFRRYRNTEATTPKENDVREGEEERRYRTAMDSYIYIESQPVAKNKVDDDYMEMMPIKGHSTIESAAAEREDDPYTMYDNTPSCSSGYMTSTPSPTTTTGFTFSCRSFSRNRAHSNTSSQLFTPLAEGDESMESDDKGLQTASTDRTNVPVLQLLDSIAEVCSPTREDRFRNNRLRELRFLTATKRDTTVIICAHDNSTVSLVENQSVVYTLPTARADTGFQMRQLLVAHVHRSQRAVSDMIVIGNQFNERFANRVSSTNPQTNGRIHPSARCTAVC